jgi:hypothetical protein
METERAVTSRLALLTEQGADRFDPIRFSYIASLVRRSAGKHAPVRCRLEHKALHALDDYQVRFEKARQEAAQHVTRIGAEPPDAAERIRGRFDQCDFHGVRRLAGRIERGRGGSVLAMLRDQIAQAGRLVSENAAQFSLDALLQRQEEDVFGSLGRSPAGQGAPPTTPNAGLRAFQLFERTWANHYADKLVTHAINHVPENPGHLNTQMLATRCLSAMRKLSPAYLRRWVTYLETLFWLEGAGRDDKSRTTKASRQS